MKLIQQRESLRIGQHLRHMRRTHDRTQEELAEMLGVSVGWVSRIERGVKLPNLPFLFRIGRALHVPINELLPAKPRRISQVSTRSAHTEAFVGLGHENSRGPN